MSKNNPQNQEEAFCYQLEEDIKLLRSISLMADKSSYDNQLKVIETRILTYRQLNKK